MESYVLGLMIQSWPLLWGVANSWGLIVEFIKIEIILTSLRIKLDTLYIYTYVFTFIKYVNDHILFFDPLW